MSAACHSCSNCAVSDAAARQGPRQRSRVGTTAAATAGATRSRSAAAPAAPLPLLPFWQVFRSQVARLEGVEALPLPPHLAEAQSAAPPVSVRAGACHADRLRFGNFLQVNASSLTPAGRPRRRGSLALLQGALLPSLFSYHPPMAFKVAAFDGGASWMVAVEYLALPTPAAGAAGAAGTTAAAAGGQQGSSPQQQQQQQQPLAWSRSSSSMGDGRRGDTSGGGSGGSAGEKQTPEAWQQAQAQRLEAVRQMHGGAALPLPGLPQQQAAGRPQQLSPARCLLSSAHLQAAGRSAAGARAALDAVGLPAFRAALSVYLNGLAAAPADASTAHVRRMAAAQAGWLCAEGRRPPLCTAQLEAAFGTAWLQELQDELLASSREGLQELLPAPPLLQEAEAAAAAAAAVQAGEWVYINPRLLMEGLQPGTSRWEV